METHISGVSSVALDPNGQLLALGNLDGSIELWDLFNNRSLCILRKHSDFISGLAFSPNGKLLASAGGGFDHTVRLWGVKQKQ